MSEVPPTTVRRLPRTVWLLAGVSLLNEISAQMVAPLIPILLASVLAAGPVAIGLVEGMADAVAAFVKVWSGRQADLRPRWRKPMVLLGYALALAARPLIALAGHWSTVAVLRATDRLGKGLRGAPRDAILAAASPRDMRGRAYGLNRGMDYAGAVVGTLLAAAALAWTGLSIEQVILMSALPGVAVLALLAALPASVPQARWAATAAGETAAAATALASAGVTGAAAVRSGQGEADMTEVACAGDPSSRRWAALPPALRQLLVLIALFGLARASEVFILLRGHELGLSPVRLLLLWAWLAALQSAVALAAAPWTDRVSKARLLPWHWASLALGWVALAAAGGEPALWAAVTLFGVLSGISEGVERALVSERASALSAAPGARRIEGTAFGWYHASGGVAAIGAGLTAGVLWQFGGAALAFGWAAAAALGCAIAFAVVERRRGA